MFICLLVNSMSELISLFCKTVDGLNFLNSIYDDPNFVNMVKQFEGQTGPHILHHFIKNGLLKFFDENMGGFFLDNAVTTIFGGQHNDDHKKKLFLGVFALHIFDYWNKLRLAETDKQQFVTLFLNSNKNILDGCEIDPKSFYHKLVDGWTKEIATFILIQYAIMT